MSNYSPQFDPVSQTLQDIMKIIGYTEQEAVETSLALQHDMFQLACINLVNKAPDEVQTKLISVAKNKPTKKQTLKLFHKYFSKEDIDTSLQVASCAVMSEYFRNVSPHLSTEQSERISSIISKHQSDMKRI